MPSNHHETKKSSFWQTPFRFVRKFRDRFSRWLERGEDDFAPQLEALESRVLLSANPLSDMVKDQYDLPDAPQAAIHMPLLAGGSDASQPADPYATMLASPVSEASAEPVATEMAYDDFGRVIRVTSEGETVNYEYDAVTGNVSRTWTGTDADNPLTDVRKSYDAHGRLESVTTHARDGERLAVPETVAYRYDAYGNLIRVDQADGSATTYSYDDAGRVNAVRQYAPEDGAKAGEGVLRADRLQSESFLQYDSQGRMSGMVMKFYENGAVTREVAQRYAYTDSGIEVQLRETAGGRTVKETTYVIGHDLLSQYDAYDITYGLGSSGRQLFKTYSQESANGAGALDPLTQGTPEGLRSLGIQTYFFMSSMWMLLDAGVNPYATLDSLVLNQGGNGSLSIPDIIDALLNNRYLSTSAKLLPHDPYSLDLMWPITEDIARRGAITIPGNQYLTFLKTRCGEDVSNWLQKEKKEIHHIVQQHQDNIDRFGKEAIHSVSNLYVLHEAEHRMITAFQNSKLKNVSIQIEAKFLEFTVREFLAQLEYEKQWELGRDMLVHLLIHTTMSGFSANWTGLA